MAIVSDVEFRVNERVTAGVGHAHWWARGGQASGMNHGAIARVVQAMAIALHKSAMPPGTLDV